MLCGSGIASSRNAMGNHVSRRRGQPPNSSTSPISTPSSDTACGYAMPYRHAATRYIANENATTTAPQ